VLVVARARGCGCEVREGVAVDGEGRFGVACLGYLASVSVVPFLCFFLLFAGREERGAYGICCDAAESTCECLLLSAFFIHLDERREVGFTCRFVAVPAAADAAAGAGALMKRGKSIRISLPSTPPTQASTTTDIVNDLISSNCGVKSNSQPAEGSEPRPRSRRASGYNSITRSISQSIKNRNTIQGKEDQQSKPRSISHDPAIASLPSAVLALKP